MDDEYLVACECGHIRDEHDYFGICAVDDCPCCCFDEADAMLEARAKGEGDDGRIGN